MANVDMEQAQGIVDYLNELVKSDPSAIAALVANRVPCNKDLAEHDTCQCWAQHGGYHVGMLGVINGICGIFDNGHGAIQVVFEEALPGESFDRLVGFRVVDMSERKQRR